MQTLSGQQRLLLAAWIARLILTAIIFSTSVISVSTKRSKIANEAHGNSDNITLMDIVFTLDGDQTVLLNPVSSRRYEGKLLPGSTLYSGTTSQGMITLQEFEGSGFTIRYNILRFLQKLGLTITEKKPGIRFQAVMKNELQYQSGKRKLVIKEGRFNIEAARDKGIQLTLGKDKENHYFLASYSPEFIASLGFPPERFLTAEKPRSLTPEMARIIQEMFAAPYEPDTLRFFYENRSRDLLLQMMVLKDRVIPGTLSAKEIEAIYAADAMLLNNIREQMRLEELVKKTGLNASKLKKGFREKFGMGIFERSLNHRMNKAKQLLTQTNLPEKNIASQAGYEHLTSFIYEFKKRFGVSPREFRKFYDDTGE